MSTDLTAWLGKSRTVPDRMDPGHAACVAATLGDTAPAHGDAVPALWPWAFCLETVPLATTGTDGE